MTSLYNWFLDILFPRRCLGCNILLGREVPSYICRGCLKTITFKNDFACAFCKSPVKNGKTCLYCIKDHFLDRLLVTTSYENPLAEKMLKTMKYRFVASLANDVAGLMIRYLTKKGVVTKLGLARPSFSASDEGTNLQSGPKNLGGLDSKSPMVVPVPLHFKRLNWRGFNQAVIMAQGIGDFFGWPVLLDSLRRRHNRKPQADMPNRTSRIKNMQNAFKISPNYQSSTPIDYPQGKRIMVAGKTILLVDDISTTGSTLNDCARVLKGAGAKEVVGFVFARNKI